MFEKIWSICIYEAVEPDGLNRTSSVPNSVLRFSWIRIRPLPQVTRPNEKEVFELAVDLLLNVVNVYYFNKDVLQLKSLSLFRLGQSKSAKCHDSGT